MKKVLVLPLSEAELLELSRIIADRDEKQALSFLLKKEVREKVRQLLEGG